MFSPFQDLGLDWTYHSPSLPDLGNMEECTCLVAAWNLTLDSDLLASTQAGLPYACGEFIQAGSDQSLKTDIRGTKKQRARHEDERRVCMCVGCYQ